MRKTTTDNPKVNNNAALHRTGKKTKTGTDKQKSDASSLYENRRLDKNSDEMPLLLRNSTENTDKKSEELPRQQKRKPGRPRGSKNRNTRTAPDQQDANPRKKQENVNINKGKPASNVTSEAASMQNQTDDFDKEKSSSKHNIKRNIDISTQEEEFLNEIDDKDAFNNVIDDDFQSYELLEDFDEYGNEEEQLSAVPVEDITETADSGLIDEKIDKIADIGHLLGVADDLASCDDMLIKKSALKNEDEKTVFLSSSLVYGRFIKQLQRECLNIYDEEIKRYCKKWKKVIKDSHVDTDKLIRSWSDVMSRGKTDKHPKKKIKKTLKRAARKAWKKLCKSIESLK